MTIMRPPASVALSRVPVLQVATLVAVLHLVACEHYKKVFVPLDEVAGTYVLTTASIHDELTLHPDGSFVRKATYAGVQRFQKGRWIAERLEDRAYGILNTAVEFSKLEPNCLADEDTRGIGPRSDDDLCPHNIQKVCDAIVCANAWGVGTSLCFEESTRFTFRRR